MDKADSQGGASRQAGLTDAERKFVEQLRSEAYEVKDCFTRYSFQAVAIATVALGFFARYHNDHPLVALVSLPIIVLLLAVARIGTHKYATANRNYGYQLHLELLAAADSKSNSGKISKMRNVGWEEAMRAWRVVQATVFETIYTVNWLKLDCERSPIKQMEGKWFMPETLLVSGGKWHAGSYLGNMVLVIHIIVVMAVPPLFFFVYELSGEGMVLEASVVAAFIPVIVTVVALRVWGTNLRRGILESGLLSIHACAIMWHAVVAAHLRAETASGRDVKTGMIDVVSYTEWLSALAVDLSENLGNIHKWIAGDDNELLAKVNEKWFAKKAETESR